jgi:hypothetical protein
VSSAATIDVAILSSRSGDRAPRSLRSRLVIDEGEFGSAT